MRSWSRGRKALRPSRFLRGFCSNYQSLNSYYPVIIVGGGPVGMLTSLLLSEYKVPHCLLERRKEPASIHRRTSCILEQWRYFKLIYLMSIVKFYCRNPIVGIGVISCTVTR